MKTQLKNGLLEAPVMKTAFGDALNLRGLIPEDCDCVLILVNTGAGLSTGWPEPVGFLKLSHQVYVREIESLIDRHRASQDFHHSTALWRISVCPVRSKDYLTIWERSN